jgi:cytochrome c oxidase subunit 2
MGAVVAIFVTLVGCATGTNELHQTNVPAPGFFPLQPASEEGHEIAALYPIIFWIAVAVFVLVEGLLLWIVLRYRRQPNDDSLPAQTHGNNRLEILWTAIPALIVTGLFVLTVQTLGRIDAVAANEPDVVVDVTGFQWQWTFDYPKQGNLSFTGSGAQGPLMVLPVGEKVRIRLHSIDVIHSFYVPAFLYKKDVIPGRVNEFDVQVNQAGIYSGQCAEFCGLGHADMLFTVEAMTRADFDAWVAAEKEKAAATPTPAPSEEPGQTPGAAVELDVTTTDQNPLTFSPTELSAPAGAQVTVVYLNDSSLPHNIRFFNGADTSADSLASTDIKTGPGAEERVTFSAPSQPGDYFFHCDVHPLQMQGFLHVGP